MKKKKEESIRQNKSVDLKLSFVSLITKENGFLTAIVLLTIIIFARILNNEFLNWDDDTYIQNNPLIFSFHIKEYFSQFFTGNYHPLTLLVLAIEYSFFGLKETGYHAFNLFLHVLNVILVYRVISILGGKKEVASITCLFFALHPLHVESVAWAAEVKDLLYSFFFLSGLFYYLRFLKTSEKRFYFYSLMLFLLSLLSKAMAASFPIVLILCDYFIEQKISQKRLLAKIPFFFLSLLFGSIAIAAQQSTGAIQEPEIFSIVQRLAFACYGFVNYLEKLILPLNLSAYYPYPVKNGNAIPVYYYFYLPLAILIISAVVYSFRFTRKIFFSFAFFSITIFLVLQLLPVGGVIMADRYSYIPSIGLFFLAGDGIWIMWNKKKRAIAIGIILIFTVFFSAITLSRCEVWKNSATLWDDVLNKYKNVPIAYSNRGFVYYKEKKYSEALDYFNKAIELSPGYNLAYNNRGILFTDLRKFDNALSDFNKAIELKPAFAATYNNRGLLLISLNKNEDAINDYSTAIKLDPNFAMAYNNRGNEFMNAKKYAEALTDYNKAISLQPNYAKAYNNRGIVNVSLGNSNEAMKDFNMSIQLQRNYAQAYYNRGVIFMNGENYENAFNDFSKAIEFDKSYSAAYLNRAVILQKQNRNTEALLDYDKAIDLNPSMQQVYFNRGILLLKEKKFDAAIRDFNYTIEHDSKNAMAYYNRGIAEYYLNKTQDACRDIGTAASMGVTSARAVFEKFCR